MITEDYSVVLDSLKADIYKAVYEAVTLRCGPDTREHVFKDPAAVIVPVKRDGLYPNLEVSSIKTVDDDNANRCIVSGRMHGDGLDYSCDLGDVSVDGMVMLLNLIPEPVVDMETVKACFEEFDGEHEYNGDRVCFHKDTLSVTGEWGGLGCGYWPTLQHEYLLYKKGERSRDEFLKNVIFDLMLPF